jgi:hypothetical protein
VVKARGWLVVALLCAACEERPRFYSTKAESGTVVFRDSFDGDTLGPHWNPTADGARVDNGVLKQEGLQNHPLWLDVPLPDDFRIDFDAWAMDPDGDIKVELCGDGKSVATSMNYIATGYVLIFGGWNNSRNAIVRKDEHGRDLVTVTEPKVEPEKRYHFTVTRVGSEIRWEVNGRELLLYEDEDPLVGPGHRHFAFSGWESQTHFDNLVIEDLR